MMKKLIFIFILCIVSIIPYKIIAGTTAMNQKNGYTHSKCMDTLANAQDAWDNVSMYIINTTIQIPEGLQNEANECLEGLLNADFGFNLGVPSANDFLNQACENIISQYGELFNDIENQLTFDQLNQYLPVGGSYESIDVELESNEIADEIWQEMNQ